MATDTQIDYLVQKIAFLEERIEQIKAPCKLLPIEEFSEGKLRKILHIGQEKLRLLVETGKLQAIRFTDGRKIRYRFTVKAVQDYQELMSRPKEPKYVPSTEELIKRYLS